MAHILVIDDDRAICSVVSLVLERQGHETVSAEDGRRGLKLLEAGDFDLLIIDIIVMSGGSREVESMPDYLPMAEKLGAIASLRKPFKPDALTLAVKRCLEGNRPME
jgi:DNA-binding NtrC family response regulator